MFQDDLKYNSGNKLYVAAYEDFLKVGVTSTPQKRIKAIVNTFGSDIDLQESYYYQMPESLANTIESKIKKEFENYEDAEKYKTECFYIEDLESVTQRIEELSNPFGEDVIKVNFGKKVSLIIDEETEKPVVRNTKSLYSTYKLIMNNQEMFDELFLERLEKDRANL